MTTRTIRFVHRGRTVSVSGIAPTRTVLDWLREDARCTGTKEGCAEGDCGACTVIVAERSDAPGNVGGLQLKTVNACIQFMPALDGKALLTVEDVTALGDGAQLHPVQQAMVDCHGSQCGFCTPGFVMSMAASYERHCQARTRPSRAELADELAGNLCRCTGYRPILDAGQRMFELPQRRLPVESLREQLNALQAEPPLSYEFDGRRFWAPRTLAEFAALREQQPQARLMAGCTDIGLWVNKQFRELGDILFIGDVAELRRIETHDAQLRIGAAVSLEDGWATLVQHWPQLQAMWLRFASPPVRHAGTLVGNLANGSPIGDGAPVLMALGATLLLRRGTQQRRLPLEAFYLGYMKNALQPGEFIEAVEVPLPTASQRMRAYKVSKRFDSDISAVAAGLSIELDGDIVRSARFAFGGMAAVVQRAAGAEQVVQGQPWNEATLTAALQALAADFQPLTDLRASAAYRTHVVGQLLRRFWLETRPAAPLPAAELDVWHDVRRAVV
ncbi:xanthine dehydrogenase small subunit [Ideonella sp. BN130291]|uniref:xanthine dehydrogenase small subunit n=1 Tax=Ideonella sp. BN130291 TaxID=3112940 RepID=UPI002E2770C2|nr:xanthine dehydrogenase small subunit [Ideonella sp. BN130291]